MSKKKNFSLVCLLFVLVSIPCNGAAHPSDQQPQLIFWNVGNPDDNDARFGVDFSRVFRELYQDQVTLDAVLLILAEEPQNMAQISNKSGVNAENVNAVMSKLISIKMLRKIGDKYALTVPVITDMCMFSIKTALTPMGKKVASSVKSKVVELENLYNQMKSAADPAWEIVAHLIIDKFLVDGSFHRAVNILEKSRGAQRQYSEDQRTLPAFFLEKGKHFSTFGTNWYGFPNGDEQQEIYVLHGGVFDRFDIPLNKYRGDKKFSTLVYKLTSDGGINSLSRQERETLANLQWLENNRLRIPIVNAKPIKSLLPLLEDIGKEAAEVVFENYDIILKSYKNSPYAKFMEGAGDYIQVCYHILFSLIIDRLVKEDVTPLIPEPVPEYFGVYIIKGRVLE